MRKEAWFEVIRPSLSDRQGAALFIGTPKGRNHFYDLGAKGHDQDETWQAFQYTTLEGGNVEQIEVAAARADLDERTFQQEYEARFVNYTGLIYYSFERAESVKAYQQKDEPLIIGMDFNLDPMSAVVMVRRGDVLYAIDEIVAYGSNTDEMVAEIRERYRERVLIHPDPACRGSAKRLLAGGQICRYCRTQVLR